MSVAIQFRLTEVGQLALWNAKKSGVSLDLTHIQLGGGNRAPDGSEVALVAPKEAAAIAGGTGVQISSTQIRMSALFSSAMGYEVREVGLWAGNPANGGSVLVGYWSQAAGMLAVKVGGVDFVFSHDMVVDGGLAAGVLNIAADASQGPALAMVAAHEGKSDPHPQYASRAGIQLQSYTAFAVTSVAPAFRLTANPAPQKLEAGLRYRVKFNATATGADTLDVNFLGAKGLKELDGLGKKVPARFVADQLGDIEYDGVDWVLLDALPPFDLSDSFDFATQIESGNIGTYVWTPAITKPRGVYLITPYVNGWYWDAPGLATHVRADAEILSGNGTCGFTNMTPDALPRLNRAPFVLRITSPTARFRLRLVARTETGPGGAVLGITNPSTQNCSFYGHRIG